MARWSCYYIYMMSIHLLFFYLSSHPIGAHNLSPSVKPLCLKDEMSALLQFKRRYEINPDASDDPLAHPKTPSWKNSRDCCSWDGIECDRNTGHVIVLDLGSSFLHGPIDNNSTLFQLAYLEKLNLSDNDFNYSQIPSRVGDLLRLTHLDLSLSVFSGRVPTEIFKLAHLEKLNLSYNFFNYSQIPSQVGDLSRLTHLNLSQSEFFGQVPTEIFKLAHLEKLDLSNNYFNYSHIPSQVGDLSRLTHLDLSWSAFIGPVPLEIFKLTKLVYLDLSRNRVSLKMEALGLRSLAQNLTSLEVFLLHDVTISSNVLNTLANMSSLRRLNMERCDLHGVFPSAIFNLPKLRHLGVGSNEALMGRLPDFNSTSLLEELGLPYTSFSGELPASIGKLPSLSYLDIGGCEFSGSLPASIGNLPSLSHLEIGWGKFSRSIPASFANFSNLEYLSISNYPFPVQSNSSFSWVWKNTKLVQLFLDNNSLYGEIPPSIGNLSRLEVLSFFGNRLSGTIPSQLINLTRLSELYLGENQLSGSIPSWLGNMTELIGLDLARNKFYGQIPSSIYQLQNLEILRLFENNFSSIVELDSLLKLKDLGILQLSSNRLSCGTGSANVIPPQLSSLGLASCNLSEFPAFLQNLQQMNWLDLSDNNIKGEVPFWVWNGSYHSMEYLNLSHNLLTSLDQYYSINHLPLGTIDLSHNQLKGPPPEAPPSIISYIVSNNNLTGALPPWICNLRSPITLDLSANNLTGALPICLGNISKSLKILNLRGNNFHGSIPDMMVKGTQLTMIDLSENQLRGKLLRSLANCRMLEFINLANNLITDTFPSRLGSLPELHVLLLRSNKFHGVLKRPISNSTFLKLRILDLSTNAFIGKLPMELFQSLNAMKSETGSFTYMQRDLTPLPYLEFDYFGYYAFSMIVIYKGLELYYPKILEVFTIIDLSSNLFEGEIPGVIGDLKGLKGLNLSNNSLTSHIPSSLGNLTALESLDLSQNKLSGQIPQKLAELGFLSYLNMSYNNLTGSIPRGKQLNTFSNESFEGNPELCGEFISRKCRDPGDASGQPSPHQEEDLGLQIELDWKIVLMGYGSGLVIGVVIGNAFISWKHAWFEGNTRRRRRPSRRQPRRGRNSWLGKFLIFCKH